MKRSAVGLWLDPNFRKLWAARTVSSFGSHIGGVALEFTAILLLGASPLQIGVLAALKALPVLSIGLVIGVWVDRLRRRPILVAADLGRVLIAGLAGYGVIGLLIPLAHGPIPVAVAFMASWQLFGDVLIAVYLINEVSVRQAIVPAHLLGRANASMQFVAGTLGPAGALLGGILGGLIGLRPALVIGVLGIMAASLWLVFSPIRSLREQPAPVDAAPAVPVNEAETAW